MQVMVRNRRLTDEEFFQERTEVLRLWKTGAEVGDLDKGVAYARGLPDSKSFPRQIDKAMQEGIPLIVPRSGLPTLELQIERDLMLQEAGADGIGIPADANGAVGQFDITERLMETRAKGPPEELLDGFPIVNLGVKALRKHTEALSIPTRDNNGQLEPRLITEICYAGGVTEQLYGALSGNVCYHKDVSLDLTLRRFQYVDRLTDYYVSRGVDLARFLHGHHTVMQIPSLETAQGIIEGLLLLTQQGNDGRPRYINLDLVLQGDLIQDVAACRAIPEIAREYFEKFGYDNVIVNTEACQWSGAFPENEGRAIAINCWQTAAATWGRACIVVVKSAEEAWRIPRASANIAGVSAAVQIRELARHTPFPFEGEKEMLVETDMFKKEVRCLVDRILELGEGDAAVGILRACETGEFDAPYLPTRHLKGLILAARDARGAVRIADPGNLPLGQEIIDFHRSRLSERTGGRAIDYRDCLADIEYFVREIRREAISR